jgi:hypothetical protein
MDKFDTVIAVHNIDALLPPNLYLFGNQGDSL